MPYTYEYPHPAVTVDCVIFGFTRDTTLEVLLIKRLDEPFKGRWAIPGGFVEMDETVEEAARRELEEETGVTDVYLEQLYTFSEPKRDPRERVITVSHFALIREADVEVEHGSDAADAQWWRIDKLPRLAFDHSKILKVAIDRIRNKVRYEPLGFNLLPTEFSLSDLQRLYENILGRELDKRNFRKRIMAMEILKKKGMSKDTGGRPARLYKFNERRYKALVSKGFNFEI